MSDEPNGHPPGQNNLNAGIERYVPLENDPSAAAQGSIETEQKDIDPKVQEELDTASKNIVQPGSVEDNTDSEKEEDDTGPTPDPAVKHEKPNKEDPNETKPVRPGSITPPKK